MFPLVPAGHPGPEDLAALEKTFCYISPYDMNTSCCVSSEPAPGISKLSILLA